MHYFKVTNTDDYRGDTEVLFIATSTVEDAHYLAEQFKYLCASYCIDLQNPDELNAYYDYTEMTTLELTKEEFIESI